jgi:hypothetical protein
MKHSRQACLATAKSEIPAAPATAVKGANVDEEVHRLPPLYPSEIRGPIDTRFQGRHWRWLLHLLSLLLLLFMAGWPGRKWRMLIPSPRVRFKLPLLVA